eukprot:GHVO01004264.1.p1 GENE.GHVO01004264.1~~GHVO01004264.1.p1  ORF type:complete len:169 (+),score=30.37 GHVO01004264.1:25-507(+)
MLSVAVFFGVFFAIPKPDHMPIQVVYTLRCVSPPLCALAVLMGIAHMHKVYHGSNMRLSHFLEAMSTLTPPLVSDTLLYTLLLLSLSTYLDRYTIRIIPATVAVYFFQALGIAVTDVCNKGDASTLTARNMGGLNEALSISSKIILGLLGMACVVLLCVP